MVLDDVLDMRQLALARKDAGRLHDGGRYVRNARLLRCLVGH